MSSAYRNSRKKDNFDWHYKNAIFLGWILVAMYLGFIYSLDGMRNTAIVYFFLFTMEKLEEVNRYFSENVWLFYFITSLIVYFLSF